MARYALILNAVIANVVEWDGETPFAPNADEIVPVEVLPAGIDIGWQRDEACQWSAPPALADDPPG